MSSCTYGRTSRETGANASNVPDSMPLSEDVVGAGGTIADGLVVPSGARLLAGVIPADRSGSYRGEPVIDQGWTAFLAVLGDPRPVLRSIIDQGTNLGFKLRPGKVGGATWRGVTFCHQQEDRYTCQALGFDGDEDGARSLQAHVYQWPEADGRPPVSYLELRLGDGEHVAPSPTDQEPVGTPGNPMGPAPSEIGANWPDLPEVGGAIGESYEPDDLYRFAVEPGSRLVAPTFFSDPIGWVGYAAIIAITGDPAEVAAAYGEQHGGREFVDPWTTPDGTRVSVFGGGGAGGADYVLTLVEPPTQPAFLYLSTGYD